METFHLKYRDTLPILDVYLLNPDGTAFDLTNSTAWKLHIRVGSVVVTRDMTKVAPDTEGHLRYAWVTTDWDAGNLTTGSHPMEYEVIGPSAARITFPNDAEDRLLIRADVGQG